MSEKVIVQPHMFACNDAEVENYVVEVEQPGVKKKDVDLTMREDIARAAHYWNFTPSYFGVTYLNHGETERKN